MLRFTDPLWEMAQLLRIYLTFHRTLVCLFSIKDNKSVIYT